MMPSMDGQTAATNDPSTQRRHYETGGVYQKNELGVLIDWHPRDPLTAWLVRLVDGVFPPRGQTLIRADSTLYYFDLGHLVNYRGGSEWADAYVPSSESADALAGALVEYGRPLLETGVGQFDALGKDRYIVREVHEALLADFKILNSA
jgi:hypothetical protein